MYMNEEKRRAEEAALLGAIKNRLPELHELWEKFNCHKEYEDGIYRFYHQSFKVFVLQDYTRRIVEALESLAPHLPLNPWFLEILAVGTGKKFDVSMNERWTEITRPIVEAFFHARYFLEMICKYAVELEEPATMLPSGWAAVLELYQIR